MCYIFDKHILGKESVEVKGRGWEGNTFCLLLLERLNSELMAIRLNEKRYVSANRATGRSSSECVWGDVNDLLQFV